MHIHIYIPLYISVLAHHENALFRDVSIGQYHLFHVIISILIENIANFYTSTTIYLTIYLNDKEIIYTFEKNNTNNVMLLHTGYHK